MQAQTQTVAPITFKGYAEKSKAKRALVKTFGINGDAAVNFLREQDGQWGFLLNDGAPYAEQIAAALDTLIAAAQTATPELPSAADIQRKSLGLKTDAELQAEIEAGITSDRVVASPFNLATDDADDTPTTHGAFAAMVNPPVAPTTAASTVVRDGKVVDPATAAADDKGDHSVEAGVDPCPLCGGDHSAQTWANEGVSAFCHKCGKTYSVSTGREVRAGFKRDDVNKGYKIEKDRPTANGVKRPSTGTLCGMVWAALDAVHATRMPVASDLDTIATTNSWNRNNVSCEFYQWRKFNGIKGRQVKSA